MSFIVEQKIGNHVYVYEARSVWDKEKKQPRQVRIYLGKKDPKTGKIIPPKKRSHPRAARDYGNIYLLDHLTESIGLKEALKAAMPDIVDTLIPLAYYLVSEAGPFYLFRDWVESTFVEPRVALDSGPLSRLLTRIGKAERARKIFFQGWVRRQKDLRGFVYDMTSFSSYADFSPLEWGYNRDQEALKQVNFALVAGDPSQLPLFYRMYPGSISDVTTLKTLLMALSGLGIKEARFALDRGFYSARNVQDLMEAGILFVMPLPFTTKKAGEVLRSVKAKLGGPKSAFLYEGHTLYGASREIKIHEIACVSHIYLDEERRAQEKNHFYQRLLELEHQVSAKAFWQKEIVEEFLESKMRGSSKYFQIRIQKDGKVMLIRRPKAISRRVGRMGIMILISNDVTIDRDEALSWYRRKAILEKIFNRLKNDLHGKRLRVYSRDTAEGKRFLEFLGLILWCALHERMRRAKLHKKYTVPQVIAEMKKLRMVEMEDGRFYLTEMTKKQRTILTALEIPLPPRIP